MNCVTLGYRNTPKAHSTNSTQERFYVRAVFIQESKTLLKSDVREGRLSGHLNHTKRRYEKNCCSAYCIARSVPSAFMAIIFGFCHF